MAYMGNLTNAEILAARVEMYSKVEGPRVGDYLDFADGSIRRVAHDWGDAVQPSEGEGSFYFGNGCVSYSGSLIPGVSVSKLIATDETRDGRVWFFDRDWARAGGGVTFSVSFRVYRVNLTVDYWKGGADGQ